MVLTNPPSLKILKSQCLALADTYWPLIRNIRIDIEDFRDKFFFFSYPNSKSFRPQKKTRNVILLPLFDRLRPLLDAAGKGLRVYIHVVSGMISEDFVKRTTLRFHGTTAEMVVGVSRSVPRIRTESLVQ